MALTRSKEPLVWIDCEMTGLDPESDHIIQISCFITDYNLELLEPNGFHVTIHQPQHVLSAMNPWCISTHARSGLTAAVLASTTTPIDATDALLTYIRTYVPESGKALLAGNTVHMDRAFLARQPYKRVIEWLHYRILDVSSVKESIRRWAADEVLQDIPEKKGLHLAKEDILESIQEMKFYRDRVFYAH
ncbi:Phosphatidylinositol 3,4,5-trisphosphate-dependent Rac exchanger 2 protein [Ophidiomyces ophidiicola]|uniref:Phosphatidylinositol 3,4,5-trisphosphate-dependent Rac exchanger 2 protein n=1 Tax=Ophidiomyces ophidiicola TaxID=1387563 RepID=A0ACB8V5C6_9EURO|nr:Phosphatidylinositol 3,4,5-trisphosphate-dependent Rac exchanger 2 protein [Ophidiomyces ophidiicola]KAI1908148.1 Phosphatidylinositol 3,4,5-trisphosphate-dependent Rac exchanger 2 protein [Ophidiomyces ophidiicola]KAI1923663.1 Phosphatidylinositol 3,4,5-trisphosphate-dependent Rac exchanger 2 protein [Ophidiomyces ophidiicola]KAI1925963.1 Phosphatidylinositol 3,4,5-trisphosphate-dependent Rac exchanger 2 protein [Ophidiomyces ophidiicola]KAI1947941.1 Phosphatidylinositol 3,4,5-trisphosphate